MQHMKHIAYSFGMFIIIFIFAFINSTTTTTTTPTTPIENFTPKIRAFYRPIIRNARISSEGIYTKSSSNINNLFRKAGIV